MAQERRFGRRIALPSTLQIVHEIKALMSVDPAMEPHVAASPVAAGGFAEQASAERLGPAAAPVAPDASI